MAIKAADMLIARRADTRARADFATWKMLAKLNGASALPAEAQGFLVSYKQLLEKGWGPVRVCIAAEQTYGHAVLGALYTAIGTRFHHEKAERDRATVQAALGDAGLPADLIEAYDSTEYDDALRASHEEGIKRVGYDVGTPIISVGELSIFGPVVSPVPRGEAAARLWDGLLLIAGTDGFFELKRSRTRDPIFD